MAHGVTKKERGTIEVLASGSIRLRVTVGYLPNGNPDRKSKIAKTKSRRQAYAELDEFIEQLEEQGFVDPDTITFGYFIEHMWKRVGPSLYDEKTYDSYLNIVETRLLPEFKDRFLTDIKRYELREFIMAQKKLKSPDEDLSRETKKRILSTMGTIYKVAEYEFRVIKEDDNPCIGLKLPRKKNEDKIKKGVQPPYSIDELQKLFASLETESLHVKAVVLTAFVTGAREGEIAALERKHYDLKKNTVLFEQRIIKLRGKPAKRIDGLKTSDSKLVDVPPYYLETMAAYFIELDEKRSKLKIDTPKHDYIFGHIDGKPINPSSLYGCWKKFTIRAGLRLIRFHDLRHSTASYLISNPSVPGKAVQEHLGHSNFSTTMDMYVHSIKESKQSIVDAIDSIIKPKDK